MAIMGALQLYLDFINLFVMLLQLSRRTPRLTANPASRRTPGRPGLAPGRFSLCRARP